MHIINIIFDELYGNSVYPNLPGKDSLIPHCCKNSLHTFFGIFWCCTLFKYLLLAKCSLAFFKYLCYLSGYPHNMGSFHINFFRTIHMETLAQILLKGATPFVYLVQRLIHLSSLVPNFSLGLTGYILFSLLILFLFWHFGHKP